MMMIPTMKILMMKMTREIGSLLSTLFMILKVSSYYSPLFSDDKKFDSFWKWYSPWETQ